MSVAGSALRLQSIISGWSRISGYGCENISCRKDKMPQENLDESNSDSAFLDGRGRLRGFSKKRLSRKKGGSLRGRGWKYGSGFVDGVFPVMGPEAQELLKFMQKEKRRHKIWLALDSLSPTHSTWDDLINVCVQLRLNKQWAIIVTLCEWILCKSSFRPDVMCYNLLIEAYGQEGRCNEAQSVYLKLSEARCVPTEDTYAVLISAYCKSALFEKADAVLAEMRINGVPSSTVLL